MESLLDGVITNPGQTLDQAVAGQGPGIPVPAFVFIEGIADPAVLAVTAGPDDFQSFLYQSIQHEVGCYLVLDSGPDLVAVDKGKRQFVTLGPGAKKQASLIPECIGGSLWVGVIG